MPNFEINNITLSGITAAVPKNTVYNKDYNLLSESEKKLLIKTTGVESKRVATKGVTTSDLCFKAANMLLEDLNWSRDEVEVLIFLSQSRDYYLPATSIILQDRLKLNKQCMAFDIGLGCSGYVYGLSIISSLMSAANLKKGMLLVGDISSITCSKEDKSTYPLFGDAGTATAFEYNTEAEKLKFNLRSDGSGFDTIIIPAGGVRNVVTKDAFEKKEIEKGIVRNNLNLALKGLDVFNFSVNEVPKQVNDFFNTYGLDNNNIDFFVMHQANKLMNETIRKKLKIDASKVPYSLKEFGNTSSASIPLTIVTQLADLARNQPLNLLLSGFGVGLSWGTAMVSTNKIICSELIEV